MTEFIQSAQEGSVPAIPNAYASAGLHTALLTDPVKIQAYRESISSQMNEQSAGPKFADLSERIASISLETSAQGASILKIGLIDPLWVIPISGFIQVDEAGYLWPPIDINFPTGTDCVWRLCQLRMVWDGEMGGEANVTLTFEDRIASLLREMSPAEPGGIGQGQPNQTLGGFIKQLVDNANSVLKLGRREEIRLVELISPQDPNYTVPINNLPSSAQGQLRKNPFKALRGVTTAQQKQLDAYQATVAQMFGNSPGGLAGPTSIAEVEASTPRLWAGAGTADHNPTFWPGPGGTPIPGS